MQENLQFKISSVYPHINPDVLANQKWPEPLEIEDWSLSKVQATFTKVTNQSL